MFTKPDMDLIPGLCPCPSRTSQEWGSLFPHNVDSLKLPILPCPHPKESCLHA